MGCLLAVVLVTSLNLLRKTGMLPMATPRLRWRMATAVLACQACQPTQVILRRMATACQPTQVILRHCRVSLRGLERALAVHAVHVALVHVAMGSAEGRKVGLRKVGLP